MYVQGVSKVTPFFCVLFVFGGTCVDAPGGVSIIVLSRVHNVLGPTSAARGLFRLWTWNNIFEKKFDLTRSSLLWRHFSFSSLRGERMIGFMLLILSLRTTHWCVFAAAILTAIPRRVRDWQSVTVLQNPPMTQPTAQPQSSVRSIHTSSTDQHTRDTDSTQLRDCTALCAPSRCDCPATGQTRIGGQMGPPWFSVRSMFCHLVLATRSNLTRRSR